VTEYRTEAEAAAALGRQSTTLEPYDLHADTALIVARVRDDENLAVRDLEQHLTTPVRPRGTVTLHEHRDFAAYTNRLGDPAETTVWADVEQLRVTAVLNDHVDHAAAGWRDHRVVLQLRRDKDWAAWLRLDGQLVDQATFAEHIENLVHTVSSPAAADMLEVSRTFQAKRHVNYSSATRLDSGDLQLSYEVDTTAKAGNKGQMEIPTEFLLGLPPFAGTDPVEIRVRLRYRVHDGGQLGIGYQILRPDLIEQAAFDLLLHQVEEDLDSPAVYAGTAPASLRGER
jgi:uncharacterized protein YfdQ (DUF2303 family)